MAERSSDRLATRRARAWGLAAIGLALALLGAGSAGAQESGLLRDALSDLDALTRDPSQLTPAFRLAILMSFLSLAPAIAMMITCFVRVAVVLALLRQALGVQQVPPTQVLMSLALFITVFVMQPSFEDAYSAGIGPYLSGKIDDQTAFEQTVSPFREYMLRQTRDQDLLLFEEISRVALPEDPSETPLSTLVPAFMLSELRTAFVIGFMLFLPFLVIDMVVASSLLSMGMIVVPPVMISLAFKLMLFVLVDGWNLIVGSLVRGAL